MSEELEVAALDPRVRWLIDEVRQPVAVSADAKTRVMAAVLAEPLPERGVLTPRPWQWAVERRTVRFSPLLGTAVAAGLVGIGVLGALTLARGTKQLAAPQAAPPIALASVPNTPASVVVEPGVVKFVFVAPSATRVTLVGDFNAWNASATPMQRTGGTWTVTLPLRAGRHLYSFVVDGSQWFPDPSAPLAPEDGFGHANSVVLVGASS